MHVGAFLWDALERSIMWNHRSRLAARSQHWKQHVRVHL
jgi:hypothetical protein